MSGSRRTRVGIALLVFGSATASAKEHLFVGAAKCRSCHKKELIGNQYEEWQKGPHAKAFTTLKGDKAIKLAKEKGLATPPSREPRVPQVPRHGPWRRGGPDPLSDQGQRRRSVRVVPRSGQ